MATTIPPPDPAELLRPLLACLPTAFASRRPPPALLPLLSPILRQRVHHLSASSDSWLKLLCWDPERASKLPGVVENMPLEPHPVSGEIELEDVEDTKYRRLDEETLQARLDAKVAGLSFIYLWCSTDDTGGGPGWRLTELRTVADADDGSEWYSSLDEADVNNPSLRRKDSAVVNGTSGAATNTSGGAREDDDDDYWNAYDRTPGRTPMKQSPAPAATASARAPSTSSSVQAPSTAELEYFARYMSEVQPAMDPHDPDEEALAPGESTLHGNTIPHADTKHEVVPNASTMTAPDPGLSNGTGNGYIADDEANDKLEHPRPSSASSMGSVEKLEQEAARHASVTQVEVAVKQHISTDLKSLFRLARGAGIEREEFERIVRTELDCLGLMDMDE